MAWTPPGLGVRHVTLEQVGITFIGPPVSERVLDCVVPGCPRDDGGGGDDRARELTEPGQNVVRCGVRILRPLNMLSTMASTPTSYTRATSNRCSG